MWSYVQSKERIVLDKNTNDQGYENQHSSDRKDLVLVGAWESMKVCWIGHNYNECNYLEEV